MTALFVLKRKGDFMRCLDIESQSSVYPSPEVGVGLAQALPGISRGEEVPTAPLFIEDSMFDKVAGSNRCKEVRQFDKCLFFSVYKLYYYVKK